jgi:phage shock protein PspC (stress-responsive transcriptional regulator)
MHSSPRTSRLTRSSSDKFIGGVAGGLGDYFGVDPIIFRIGFAISVLFSGAGLIAYLVMLAVLPAEDAEDRTPVPA